jgi:hypothetical protein
MHMLILQRVGDLRRREQAVAAGWLRSSATTSSASISTTPVLLSTFLTSLIRVNG